MLQNPNLRPSNGRTVRLPPNSAPVLFPAIDDFFKGVYFPPLGDPATREAFLPGTISGFNQMGEAFRSTLRQFMISSYDRQNSCTAESKH